MENKTIQSNEINKREEKNNEKNNEKKEGKEDTKCIFRLFTKEGYTFKVVVDLLKHRIKNCNFIIDKKGIFIKESDSKNYNLIILKLYGKNMKYFCNKQIVAGLNMIHLQKNLKSLKKKDGLSLYIETKSPTNFIINPVKPDFSGSTKNTLKLMNLVIQNCLEPEGYNEDDTVVIFSKDFQKMIKELCAVGSKTINIQRRNKIMRFYNAVGDLYNAEIFLGDTEDEDPKEKFNSLYEMYNSNFQLTDISQLLKIAGLSSIININATKGLPLRIIMSIGNIGKIILYTKSKEIIEAEENEQTEIPEICIEEKN